MLFLYPGRWLYFSGLEAIRNISMMGRLLSIVWLVKIGVFLLMYLVVAQMGVIAAELSVPAAHYTNNFKALAAIYMPEGGSSNYAPDRVVFSGMSAKGETLSDEILCTIREQEGDSDYQDVVNIFKDDEAAWQGFYSLSRISYVRSNPLRAAQVVGLTANMVKDLVR